MSGLINELTGEHEALKALLVMIRDGSMEREEKQVMLQTTKAKLLEHLEKEDARLYPFLREQAERDAALKQKLQMFDKNMEQVTGKVLKFYEQYENGWTHKQRFSFIMDLAEVTALLERRITIEEANLYPEYIDRQSNAGHQTNPGVLQRLKGLFGF